MDILLLRHAETNTNQAGSLSSGSEDSLTEYGYWQAQAIVDGLMELEIEAVLCSPYSRALETVEPFAKSASLPVLVHPCLAEGQLVLNSSVSYEEPAYMQHASGYLYPTKDESAGAFLKRVMQAKEVIFSQSVSRPGSYSWTHDPRVVKPSFSFASKNPIPPRQLWAKPRLFRGGKHGRLP